MLARFDGLELVDAVTSLAHNSVSQPLRQYLGCFSETFGTSHAVILAHEITPLALHTSYHIGKPHVAAVAVHQRGPRPSILTELDARPRSKMA